MAQLSLPLFTSKEAPRVWTEPRLLPATTPTLPRLEYITRQGSALHPAALAPQEDVLALNLTRGCMHRCIFCSARANPGYPGDAVLSIYADTPRQVEAELQRGPRPQAVYISPSTDPFLPLNEVQTLTADVVDVLARHNVTAWLMTRGAIRPAIAARLAAQRQRVKVTVAFTTLKRALQRTLEPLAASPSLRLKQLDELKDVGVPVQVSLDPLIPGLTDTRENLEPLLDALAEREITQISASYLFLRESIVEQLRRGLAEPGVHEVITEAFRGGPILSGTGLAAARYLPRARRQRGYSQLMALAASRGITVHISALTNPDFAPVRKATPAPRAPLGLRATFEQGRTST